MANCPYCKRYFAKKDQAIAHINRTHGNYLTRDNMDASQALYFSTHGRITGICQCGCGRKTEWNYKTGKPYKVSDNPECRERLRTMALANHRRVYGKDTLLNDAEHQKKMLQNRGTSGEYKFHDGGSVGYASTLEKAFLYFCDVVLELTSNMVQDSPEIFTYKDPKDGKVHQYIPDYYLPDYNLIVEIKDGGEHPNGNPAFIKETKYKVALKDAAMRKQTKYNYIKIVDRNYGPLMEALYQITHNEKDENKSQRPLIVITEAACMDYEENIDFLREEYPREGYLVLLKDDAEIIYGLGLIPYGETNHQGFFVDYKACSLRFGDVVEFAKERHCSIYYYKAPEELGDGLSRVYEVLTTVMAQGKCNKLSVMDLSRIMAEYGLYWYDMYSGTGNNRNRQMSFVPYIL